MSLVGVNLHIRATSRKKTRTLKKISGTTKNKDKIAIMTFLLQVLILFLKKKKKTSVKSNIFTIREKAIIPQSVLRKKIQKTSVSLGNFYVGDCS